MSGFAAIDSRTALFAFGMRATIGFLGVISFEGSIQKLSPTNVAIKGKATIDFSVLNQILDDFIGVIVKAISGTTDPEKSVVAKALNILFLPLKIFKRGSLYYDNQEGSMGIELVLDIFGERVLGFSMPTPVRRSPDRDANMGLCSTCCTRVCCLPSSPALTRPVLESRDDPAAPLVRSW